MMSAKKKEKIIQLYQSGRSAASIGREFGHHTGTITDLLKASGIKMRSLSESHRLLSPCRDNAFEAIETDSQAYWLGFLTADGGVSDENKLRVNLQLQDSLHLERLRNFFLSDNEIGEYHLKGFSKKTGEPWERHGYYFQLGSEKLCNDLRRHGIGPRKSETCLFNNELPEHLYGSYFRGLFDGDGGWTGVLNSKSGAIWSLNNNRSFLMDAQQKLMATLGFRQTKLTDHHSTSWMARLQYGGSKQLIRLVRWMYADATVWLPRKANKYCAYVSQFYPDMVREIPKEVADSFFGFPGLSDLIG